MVRHRVVLAVLCCALGPASADWYTVTNTNDSGAGSLRWAIEQANAQAVDTAYIDFSAALSGSTISPLTPLPAVALDRTSVEGDLDRDGDPDVTIDGHNLTTGSGLRIEAEYCDVVGLAIVRCPGPGLRLYHARWAEVGNCHLGADLAGTTKQANIGSDLFIRECDGCDIGSSVGHPAPNIIAGGIAGTISYGVRIVDSTQVDVSGNYIGLKRGGAAAFGGGSIGVSVESITLDCDDISIGDPWDEEGNLFAGLREGIRLYGGLDHQVCWNWFGLAADGETVLPLTGPCVRLTHGVCGAEIGETFWGPGPNVFAGNASSGVLIEGASATANYVRGNYFGCNASGTQTRLLTWGVDVLAGAGVARIGGSDAESCNYFTSKIGVAFAGGTNSIVQGNRFGVLPDGTGVDAQAWAVTVGAGVDVLVEDNVIARSSVAGVLVDGTGANPRIFGNTLRNCATAVQITNDARCCLGNLSDARTDNDGANLFRQSNTWQIRNETDNGIRAEGNDFGTTRRARINAKIWDRRDDPTLGRVDYSPLIGGVSPIGPAGEGALALTGLAGVPTQAGAQLTFTLSCPAEVSVRVLNLAGRPIRALCRARACDAGTNTLLWDARTGSGLAAPSGAYLLEVSARTTDGAQTRAVTQTRLTR